jgi:hypothetical protein
MRDDRRTAIVDLDSHDAGAHSSHEPDADAHAAARDELTIDAVADDPHADLDAATAAERIETPATGAARGGRGRKRSAATPGARTRRAPAGTRKTPQANRTPRARKPKAPQES